MVTLRIHTRTITAPDTLTAIEHDMASCEINYIESFDSWAALLSTLGEHMSAYAWIEVCHM